MPRNSFGPKINFRFLLARSSFVAVRSPSLSISRPAMSAALVLSLPTEVFVRLPRRPFETLRFFTPGSPSPVSFRSIRHRLFATTPSALPIFAATGRGRQPLTRRSGCARLGRFVYIIPNKDFARTTLGTRHRKFLGTRIKLAFNQDFCSAIFARNRRAWLGRVRCLEFAFERFHNRAT